MNSTDIKTTEMKTRNRNQEVEQIDLLALFLKIKSYWYVVLCCLIVGVLGGFGYYKFLTVPQYQSTAQVYLRGSGSNISLQDLQLGSELTKDYEIIFKSRPNMEKIISTLNLEYTPTQLASMISITNPSDTRILQVSVTTDDPNLSRDIANEVVENGMDSVREIDSQEPYPFEYAIANGTNVGMSAKKAGILGGMLGLVISLGFISIKFILSDSVQSIEDVERTLGLPVLSVVAEDKSLSYTKKKTAAKKKKAK